MHFVIFPLLLVNLGWQIYMLTQERSFDRAEMILVAIVLGLLSFAARSQPLRVQDRLIRLKNGCAITSCCLTKRRKRRPRFPLEK